MTQPGFSTIEIRIESLEIDRLCQAEVPAFQRGVERELTRLVTAHGLTRGLSESREVISTTMPDQSPANLSLADRVAAAVYQALTG
jgi:hypothetical protein